MKKEIINLLKKEEGKLKINNNFQLNRYTKDALNEKVDVLRLEGNLINVFAYSKEIKAREFSEIKEEIEAAMKEALEEYTEKLLKDFKNGYLYK